MPNGFSQSVVHAPVVPHRIGSIWLGRVYDDVVVQKQQRSKH